MDLSKNLQEYLNELSSNSPTPGGGNVAALCGALSASLGIMVCSLTIGKKKYADFESEMTEIKQKLELLKDNFIELAARDNAAFDKVMEAFKLPKETDEEKNVRTQKIDEATFDAAAVPLEVIKKCKEVVPLMRSLALKGNRNSVSDTGVAAILFSSSAQGAFLNVLINCSSLKNQTIATEVVKSAEILLNEIKESSDSILQQITSGLRE